MVEIAEINSAEILSRLPEIVPWDASLLDDGINVLICCAGFEDRATAILADLAGVPIRNGIVVLYSTNPADNVNALERFRHVTNWEIRTEFPYDRATFTSMLRQHLKQWRDEPAVRVVIDLSGMSSYLIYRVLSAVWEELPAARLGVYYAEAQEYAPTRQEWNVFFDSIPLPQDNLAMAEAYQQNHFQSIGIDITYESEVFPGKNVGPQATEVVAIPSFSLQRMKAMLAFAEGQYNVRTSNVRWFLGHPPDRVRNGWRLEALAQLYNVTSDAVGVSTRDYRDALLRLDMLWEELLTERHLVLAPLGSKMQHLACFLFLKMHSECGLLLCEPDRFLAEKYSQRIGPRWWLDFGEIQKLQLVLRDRGKLKCHWSDDRA
jgi:hypothetical protein